MSTELVFRHLPDPYRRSGTATVAHAVTGVVADALAALEKQSLQVLKARFIDLLADLDDAERLAALFSLVPWPEEDLSEFRHRIQLMTRIYLDGAATASRLLEVAAAATDSTLKDLILPGQLVPWTGLPNDRYTTIGILTRRADPSQGFIARVVDLPPVWQSVTVTPNGGFAWDVENNCYIDPHETGFSPEPVIDIVAVEHPVSLPVLVQRDLRRFVLVNRQIPPGTTLRVDLRTHELSVTSGPPALTGPLQIDGKPAPALLYGTGGLVEDLYAGRLTEPSSKKESARPFHLLRWSQEIQTHPPLAEVPGAPGTVAPVPQGPLPWPPLLGPSLSHWRLMAGVNSQGFAPTLDEVLELDHLRVVPSTEALGPARLDFRWLGRQLATFTLDLPAKQLCDGPVASGKLKHRAGWLVEQIQRLKLAGVIYLDPAATALGELSKPPGAPKEPEEGRQWGIALWEVHPPQDSLEVKVNPLAFKRGLKEKAELTDVLSVTVTAPEKEE